jgi:hypothetical protein
MREAMKRLIGTGTGCGYRYPDEPVKEAFRARLRLGVPAKERRADERIWGIAGKAAAIKK